MKKFLTSLFILAVFSGVVFYIGWTQFRVKPEQIGVVISKTDGISKKVVKNGEFAWCWQFLLPTNAELKTFSIKPVNAKKTVRGRLPSGEVYTSIANSNDDFSYEFEYSISLTIYPEAIVSLLEMNKVTDDKDLQEYLEGAADTIAQLASDYLIKRSQENSLFRPESVRREELLKYIKIYEDYPEIELSTFAIINSRIPDYNLYKRLQNDYLSGQVKYVDNQKEADTTAIEQTEVPVPEYQF